MSGPESWATELVESAMGQLPRGVVGYAILTTGGTQRGLAAHLGVSTRTVERWMAYEGHRSGQARNPAHSPYWQELQDLADEARWNAALDRLEEGDWTFESDGAEVYDDSADAPDGPRNARSVDGPVADTSWIAALRSGTPAAQVGEMLGRALAQSYGMPEYALHFTSIDGLTAHL